MAVEKWEIDMARSGVRFTVRHMVISKVHGQFTQWSGTLDLDPSNLTTSNVEVKIEAASIETRDKERDAYLQSADFLDPERHPTITFRSTRIEQVGPQQYNLRGALTIRGVTREVALDTVVRRRGKEPREGQRIEFEATTKIDRKDFGLQWSAALEAGGFLVGDTVDVALAIEAKKLG
jgi:polyisoprenoid-binding protein YceI